MLSFYCMLHIAKGSLKKVKSNWCSVFIFHTDIAFIESLHVRIYFCLLAFACFFVTALRRKLTSLYQSLSRSEAEHNDSLTEADKKLRMCNGQADDLHGYNSLLRKGMKNLTSQNTVLLRDRARLSWALKSRKFWDMISSIYFKSAWNAFWIHSQMHFCHKLFNIISHVIFKMKFWDELLLT